jgi:hypothetical protein
MAHAHTCPLLQNLPRPFVPSAALTIAELTILYPFSASLVCRVASLLSVAAGAPREHRVRGPKIRLELELEQMERV